MRQGPAQTQNRTDRFKLVCVSRLSALPCRPPSSSLDGLLPWPSFPPTSSPSRRLAIDRPESSALSAGSALCRRQRLCVGRPPQPSLLDPARLPDPPATAPPPSLTWMTRMLIPRIPTTFRAHQRLARLSLWPRRSLTRRISARVAVRLLLQRAVSADGVFRDGLSERGSLTLAVDGPRRASSTGLRA